MNVNKRKEYFNKLFYIYLITALIGANIAIGFIALSHLLSVILITFYFFKLKSNNSTKGIKYNKLLHLSILIIALIVISIVSNLKELDAIFHGIKKIKYFIIICLLIYLLGQQKLILKIEIILKSLIFVSLLIVSYGLYQYITEGGRVGSFSGVMNGPHNLSIITLLLISIWSILFNTIRFRFNLLILITIILNIFILLNSSTRGAIIAFIGGLFGILLFSKIKIKWKALIFTLMAFSLSMNSNLTYDNFIQNRKGSNDIRWQLTQFGIAVIKEYPITGIGYKQFNSYFQGNHTRYGIDSIDPRFTDHAHNTYIEIGATVGIPSLLIFFLFFLSWLKINYRSWEYRIIFIPALISVSLSGLTHHNLGIAQNMTFITLLLAVNLTTLRGFRSNAT